MNATDAGPLYTGNAVPYSYIGDSHSGAMGTLVFDDPQSCNKIVTQTLGIWRFVAADMMGDDGLVSEAVTQVLRRLGAFHSQTTFPQLAGLRPVLTRYGNQMLIEQLEPTSYANEIPFVFTVGEINIRYLLQRFVADEIDFEVPFSTAGLEGLSVPTPRSILTAQQMLNLLAGEFKSLFRGLSLLRKLGLKTLFLHSVAPPTADDEDSARVLKHRSCGIVRYKMTMFVNYLYEAVCRELDVGFVNMWPQVTAENVLDSKYYLDGLHLNREHSILSVKEVYRQMNARSHDVTQLERVQAQ